MRTQKVIHHFHQIDTVGKKTIVEQIEDQIEQGWFVVSMVSVKFTYTGLEDEVMVVYEKVAEGF